MAAGTVSDRPMTAPRPSAAPAPRRQIPAWYADVAGSLMWLSLLVVTALWVANGGLQEPVAGSPSGLTSLGRLTGLLSADLLLIQVLLMSRIPFVEQAYGQDELARRHRLIGFTSFNLMLAHIALTILGYTGSGTLGLVGQTWDLVVNYPGMLLATAATGLLVLVVVTSVKAARASIRYESWHLLHLYAYLGVGLAIPHEVWTGADFIASPLSRLYWWSLYAAALGAVLSGGSACRSTGRCGTGSSCTRWSARRPAWCRCTCAAATSTGWVPAPGSSSPGGSSTVRAGPAATPTPCPRPRPTT